MIKHYNTVYIHKKTSIVYINYSFHSVILFFFNFFYFTISITALVQCDFLIFLNTFSFTNSTQSTKLIRIGDITIYTVVFSGRKKSYLNEFMSLAKL